MGSRGAFVNVDASNFNFNIGGQTFKTIGELGNIKILVKTTSESVAAPTYSHTPDSSYAIIQDGKLKHISYYENHRQVKCVDFEHKHKNMVPHYHLNLDHTNAYLATEDDLKIAKKISRRFHLTWKK